MLEDIRYYFFYEGQDYFIIFSDGLPYLFIVFPDNSYDSCDYISALNFGLSLYNL